VVNYIVIFAAIVIVVRSCCVCICCSSFVVVGKDPRPGTAAAAVVGRTGEESGRLRPTADRKP